MTSGGAMLFALGDGCSFRIWMHVVRAGIATSPYPTRRCAPNFSRVMRLRFQGRGVSIRDRTLFGGRGGSFLPFSLREKVARSDGRGYGGNSVSECRERSKDWPLRTRTHASCADLATSPYPHPPLRLDPQPLDAASIGGKTFFLPPGSLNYRDLSCSLLPAGEGGAKRRMRVRRSTCLRRTWKQQGAAFGIWIKAACASIATSPYPHPPLRVDLSRRER